MTVTPWSDAARALVGAAFGNPEMRAEQEKMDLERQKVDIQQRQYQLEEALNPAKIGQAEAAAGYDNARTTTEGISAILEQIKLDGMRGFMEGGNGAAPMQPPASNGQGYAPMPAFNPSNVGPQGQGNNPAITTPYDQIVPLDTGLETGDALPDVAYLGMGEFDGPLPALPPSPNVPYNPNDFAAPNPFDDLIAGLTGQPNAAPVEQDLAQNLMQEPTPANITDRLFPPDMKNMIAAGLVKPEDIGKLLLADEASAANQGVTDPNKRIQNAAAGQGTFLSPDEVLAQALGATRDTATLGDLAETNLGTADIQNFEYGQNNTGFEPFLDRQNATPSFSVTNPDGTVVTYGSSNGTGGKPPTEAQGKNYTTANALQEPISIVQNMNAEGYEPNFTDYTLFTQSINSPMGASVAIPSMSPEGQRYYGAIAPVAASIANLLSGQGMTDTEQQRRLIAIIPIPGEDKQARQLKFNTMMSYFDSATANSGRPLRPMEGATDSPEVTTQEQYDDLAPGTTYKEDGQLFVKP